MSEQMRYKDAGVDIAAGEKAVDRIRELVRSTFTSQVVTGLGKFGGFYALDLTKSRKPVLVSSIDGVGTKLKVAFLMKKHDSVGEDLINHCVNDILAGGAKPLFFLDYISTGKLEPGIVEEIISGMVRACRQVDCSLVGGEMAEMPGFYRTGEYDVAGCIVGIVEKDQIIDGSVIQKGDVLVGLPSNGLHTNGYSLARKVLLEEASFKVDTYVDSLGTTVGEELLRVHRCYFQSIYPLLQKFKIKGMSHVTGGGLVGNTKRILPKGQILKIDWKSWTVPPVFRLIQEQGNVSDEEMQRTFNLGIGFVVIVGQESVNPVMKTLKNVQEDPVIIGRVD